eukprot:Amastigsp_a842633_145.p3 type:complete len:141 gc:universal Amastigsp_a842633_145:1067-645(-)
MHRNQHPSSSRPPISRKGGQRCLAVCGHLDRGVQDQDHPRHGVRMSLRSRCYPLCTMSRSSRREIVGRSIPYKHGNSSMLKSARAYSKAEAQHADADKRDDSTIIAARSDMGRATKQCTTKTRVEGVSAGAADGAAQQAV